MDKRLWMGVLVGAAATILVFGGIAAVGATAMGMGGMDGMMEDCQRMMEDHEHGQDPDGGHAHGDGSGDANASSQERRATRDGVFPRSA